VHTWPLLEYFRNIGCNDNEYRKTKEVNMKGNNIAPALKRHNQPPKELNDFLILDSNGNGTGRMNFTNTLLKKYLKRKCNPKTDKYVENAINDSEKIGLNAKANFIEFSQIISPSSLIGNEGFEIPKFLI
jgi:hypothetical protein